MESKYGNPLFDLRMVSPDGTETIETFTSPELAMEDANDWMAREDTSIVRETLVEVRPHEHRWGEPEKSRLAGSVNRPCLAGMVCGVVTLDLDPTYEDEDADEDPDEDEPTFRLTIHHDEFPHDPPDADSNGLYKVHSFNDRHTAFMHPTEVLACVECGDQRDEYHHTDVPQVADEFYDHEALARQYREDHPDELHEYRMREGFFLSYFEHGQCKWGLAGSMSGMPDFRWDGTEFAGFLEVNPGTDDGDRTWYDEKTDEEKTDMAASFMEEYTSWANGEIYGYTLERINPSKCNLGFTHEDPTDEDSCWGFIGFDWFQEAVQEVTEAMDATEDNTEVVDKAYGMADYGTFFPNHTSEDHERIEKTTGAACTYAGCVKLEVPETEPERGYIEPRPAVYIESLPYRKGEGKRSI